MKSCSVVFLAITLGLAARAAAAERPVFVLKRAGADVSLERLMLAPGESRPLKLGGDSVYVDIIFPPAPGGSGTLAQTSRARTITVHNSGGALHWTEGDGAKQRELKLLDDVEEYDIRVCVTAADGKQWAYLIDRYKRVIRDRVGPVVDIFAGQLPLQPGDYVICTDTVRVVTTHRAHGTAPLKCGRYLMLPGALPDEAPGEFILDLGAGQTVVARSSLSQDIEIREAHMVQYSAAGKKLLKYQPVGATGKIDTIVGYATLPKLTFGDITFDDAEVAVISGLPKFEGRTVAGILGIDLLRRAPVVALDFATGADASGKLSMLESSRDRDSEGPGVQLPFSIVNTHVMVPAECDGKRVALIVDTGAPQPILDAQAAHSCGIKLTGAKSALGGLDQGRETIRPATAKRLQLGDYTLKDVSIEVGALPVFAPLRAHGQAVGLLGNSIFAQFTRLELDFPARRVRLCR